MAHPITTAIELVLTKQDRRGNDNEHSRKGAATATKQAAGRGDARSEKMMMRWIVCSLLVEPSHQFETFEGAW